MWWIIGTALIVVIVVIVVLLFFKRGSGAGYDDIQNKIDALKDCDEDQAVGLFDKCPCDPSITDQWGEENKDKKCNTICDNAMVANCNNCGKLTC